MGRGRQFSQSLIALLLPLALWQNAMLHLVKCEKRKDCLAHMPLATFLQQDMQPLLLEEPSPLDGQCEPLQLYPLPYVDGLGQEKRLGRQYM